MANDERKTRFTLNELPKAPVFQKDGMKMPVFGKAFKIVSPPVPRPEIATQAPPRPFAVDPSRGFHALDVRVKVPEYKPPKVKIELGREGESTRAFKPLVSKVPQKGLTRDR